MTPWEKKGLVMRMVMEWAKDRDVLLVDGVKVLHDDGWALVFPDPEEPLTHVWAEAATDADAPGPGPGVRSPDPQPVALLSVPLGTGSSRRHCPSASSTFPAMNVPDDLRYTSDHEWARLEGGQIRIGITDYAQDALGDVVFVQLPGAGGGGPGGRVLRGGGVDQVGLGRLRPGQRHRGRGQRRAGRRAPAAQRGPVRRRLAVRDRARTTPRPCRRCSTRTGTGS